MINVRDRCAPRGKTWDCTAVLYQRVESVEFYVGWEYLWDTGETGRFLNERFSEALPCFRYDPPQDPRTFDPSDRIVGTT